jgi:hypothetical protein
MRLRCSHVGTLLLCSRLLYTEDLLGAFFPRVNDEKKRSLRNLNTAKLDGLFSVLCAVCVYCVSCVQVVYISSRMDRNTISCLTGLPCRGSGGSSWGLVMCILRLSQKSTARFSERARSKRRGGSKTLFGIVHFFSMQ